MRSLRLIVAALALLLVLVAPAAMTADAQLDCRLLKMELFNNNQLVPGATAYSANLNENTFTTFVASPLPYSWVNPTLQFTAQPNSLLHTLITIAHIPGVEWPQVQLTNMQRSPVYGFVGNTYTPTFLLNDTGLPTTCGRSKTFVITSNETLTSNGRVNECNYTYFWTVATTACVVGDPMFAGLRGQHFQVHGIDGMVYSLISAPHYAVNSRFDFLSGPRPCPIMPTTGAKAAACWTHPGSYVGAIGVKTTSGDSLVVESGPANDGFASVLLNGRQMKPGDIIGADASSHIVFSFNSTHELSLEVGDFSIVLENVDSFVNLRSVFVSRIGRARLASENVHGLLGQTWRLRHYSGAVSEIEGEVDQYVIESNELLDTRFAFSRFNAPETAESAAQ